MPVSDRKLAANRANSQKSTGPRSEEGKKKSRVNSLKHGQCALVVPVPGDLARDLRQAAAGSPDAVTDELGTRIAAGPLGIMLVGRGRGTAYVLTGTVTLDALQQAARALPELNGRP